MAKVATPATTGVPFYSSLRVRLPLLICGLMVCVLGAFMWTVNRSFERVLVDAGLGRTQAAAGQLASLLGTSVARGLTEERRIARLPDVLAFVESPSPEREAAVRAILRPLAAANQPPVVILDAAGHPLLEVAAPTTVPLAIPYEAASPGLSELREFNHQIYYEMVEPIETAAPHEEGPRQIGTIVLRRTLSAAQASDAIARLVGIGARIAIGNAGGTVWSDFSKPVDAPPVTTSDNTVIEYTLQNGERRVGASVRVASTPWSVWVDFSRAALVQPARQLAGRLLILTLFFVVLATGAVAFATLRITTPLHELTQAATAIAGGEFSRRVQGTRRDEIGRLGVAFNAMTEHVESSHRELERRVDERTAGLNAALQELEAFSYSVSHDLRAPLRHVAGFAALLEKSSGPRLDDQGRRYVQIITEATARMGRLIDDLLAFSRVGRTQLTVTAVPLGDLVTDIQREIDADAKTPITWRIGPLPVVRGDPTLLRLAFLNLLSNAAKYSSTRAEPEIAVEARDAEEADRAVICVRDNGVGFDMQYAHKLFGVFQRLHSQEAFEGTGIGLANVRRIVQRHGGEVRAEGTVDGGAAFFVTLPLESTTA